MNITDRLELEINRYEKSPMRIHPHAIKLCIDAKREIETLKEFIRIEGGRLQDKNIELF
mgnify:CR=1|tara:strand:+ start:89 stop:265 length:177 start_codon:yes stop_codon:yes gene_type:complete